MAPNTLRYVYCKVRCRPILIHSNHRRNRPCPDDYDFIFWHTSNGKDQRCHLHGRDVGTAYGVGTFL